MWNLGQQTKEKTSLYDPYHSITHKFCISKLQKGKAVLKKIRTAERKGGSFPK